MTKVQKLLTFTFIFCFVFTGRAQVSPPIFIIQPVPTNVEVGKTLTLTSAVESFYFYTVGTNNRIYEISNTGAQREVCDLTSAVGTDLANGAAFDASRGQFFFALPNPNGTGPASLWYWNQATNSTPVNLGSLPDVRPDNAAFWNNAYWYIQPATHTLRRIALQYDGANNPTMVLGGASSATMVGGVPTTNNNYIGDVAINIAGVLYATTANGNMFYSLRLPSGALSGTITATSLGTVGSPIVDRLQISFDAAGTTLYGHSFGTGQWYIVNQANGALSPLGFTTLTAGAANGFQDISGSAGYSSFDTSSGTLSYQWFKNNIIISGATFPTYTVASATLSTAGTYKVTASRTINGATSSIDSNSVLVTVIGGTAPSNVKITIIK